MNGRNSGEVTPAGLQKEITLTLAELLGDTGFKKKRIGWLWRTVGECRQMFTISVSRVRGLPGNLYSVWFNLNFTYQEVDRITSLFLGMDYDPKWAATGAWAFFTQIPENSNSAFQYCTDEPMRTYAERMAAYFRTYALPFYDKIDTLEKVEELLEQTFSAQDPDRARNFRVVLMGRPGVRGNGDACCYAAILCVQEKWDKLRDHLAAAERFSAEERARITAYMLDK